MSGAQRRIEARQANCWTSRSMAHMPRCLARATNILANDRRRFRLIARALGVDPADLFGRLLRW
jgi:hypothetical protein